VRELLQVGLLLRIEVLGVFAQRLRAQLFGLLLDFFFLVAELRDFLRKAAIAVPLGQIPSIASSEWTTWS